MEKAIIIQKTKERKTMSNLTTTTKNTFSLAPTSLKEAMEYAEIMAKSSIVPKDYQGKAADIFVAVQMGSEVGLKPLQSLTNIAVVNGRPALYGDALIALVQANPVFENITEYYDEKLKAAVCKVKRKNQSEHTVIFSEEDATKAGLLKKTGPWTQYPKRMLQMRARGFALRDKFADLLSGIISVEEAQDYVPLDVTPKHSNEKLNHTLSDDNIIIEAQENEQEIMSQEKLLTIAKEFGNLCKQNDLNAKEFAEFHNIRSDKPETVIMGIENFELLKEKFVNAAIDNTH